MARRVLVAIAAVLLCAVPSAPAGAAGHLIEDVRDDGWGPAAVVPVAALSDGRVDLLAGDIVNDPIAGTLTFTIDVADLSQPGPLTRSRPALLHDEEYLSWSFGFTHDGQRYEAMALIDKQFSDQPGGWFCVESSGICGGDGDVIVDAAASRVTIKLSLALVNYTLGYLGRAPIETGSVLEDLTMSAYAVQQWPVIDLAGYLLQRDSASAPAGTTFTLT